MKKNRWIETAKCGLLIMSLLAAVPLRASEGKAAEGNEAYRVSSPNGIYADGEGLFVLDGGSNLIYTLKDKKLQQFIGKVRPETIYGDATGGYLDASYLESCFEEPYDMEPFLDGYAISDTENNVIRYAKENRVYTAVGKQEAGLVNAKGVKARFNGPKGLASDEEGNLYIADCFNNVIRKLDKDGNVTTYAGTVEGYKDGTLTEAAFCEPAGLDWYQGALYVADSGNHCIRKIENGRVTTVAGGRNLTYEDSTEKLGDYKDGPLATALFDRPEEVVVRNGIIYVADSGNSAFRKIENYRVTTIDKLDTEKAENTYPAKPSSLAFYKGKLYGGDSFTGMVYALPESGWRTTAEKKLAALIKKLPNTVKKATKEVAVSETAEAVTFKSLGNAVPVKVPAAGTLKLTIYSKKPSGAVAFSQSKKTSGTLKSISLSEAEYDAGFDAYRQELTVTGLKKKTYYLLADKGAYGLESQLYRTAGRKIKNKAVTVTAERDTEETVSYKYKASASGTVTVKLEFLDFSGRSSEKAKVTLYKNGKKQEPKLQASTKNTDSKNKLTFKVSKGKTYEIRVKSRDAYQLALSLKKKK